MSETLLRGSGFIEAVKRRVSEESENLSSYFAQHPEGSMADPKGRGVFIGTAMAEALRDGGQVQLQADVIAYFLPSTSWMPAIPLTAAQVQQVDGGADVYELAATVPESEEIQPTTHEVEFFTLHPELAQEVEVLLGMATGLYAESTYELSQLRTQVEASLAQVPQAKEVVLTSLDTLCNQIPTLRKGVVQAIANIQATIERNPSAAPELVPILRKLIGDAIGQDRSLSQGHKDSIQRMVSCYL